MVNRENYVLVCEYLAHLKNARCLVQGSIGRYKSYLKHLLRWADENPFAEANKIQPSLTRYLVEMVADGKQKPLSPTHVGKIIQTAKRFFGWAKSRKPSCRSLPQTWIDDLQAPRKQWRNDEGEYVTLDEVYGLLGVRVPEEDLATCRDQAAVALMFLTGIRPGALVTLPIQAVDIAQRAVRQWPALGVHTKNGKSGTTYMLALDLLLRAVQRWDRVVRSSLPPDSLWYAPLENTWGEQVFSPRPASCNRTSHLAKRMRRLFGLAGLPYKSPHKFRRGFTVYAAQHSTNMSEYKCVSENLMHEDIRTTDGIYARLRDEEVRKVITSMGETPANQHSSDDSVAHSSEVLPYADLPLLSVWIKALNRVEGP